jgi:hypothetical protein
VIVLDTNVLAEPLKSDAEEAVLGWIAGRHRDHRRHGGRIGDRRTPIVAGTEA